MSTKLLLSVEGFAHTYIGNVIAEMARLATHLDVVVQSNMNGVDVFACPNCDAGLLFTKYQAAIEELPPGKRRRYAIGQPVGEPDLLSTAMLDDMRPSDG